MPQSGPVRRRKTRSPHRLRHGALRGIEEEVQLAVAREQLTFIIEVMEAIGRPTGLRLHKERTANRDRVGLCNGGDRMGLIGGAIQ